MLTLCVEEARPMLERGGILAYPTEAVYGLGCDPFNQTAIESIHALKGREADKGFIVLIAEWKQLFPLIAPVSEKQLATVRATWPGFVTWVFPREPSLPEWISGKKNSIAIRMSAHPIAQALSASAPIISTSANLSGHPPATTIEQLLHQFPTGIDALVQGTLGGLNQPSPIYDVLSGKQLR